MFKVHTSCFFKQYNLINLSKKSLSIIFWVYLIVVFLLSVLPINAKNSDINHIFVLRIRMDYLLHSITLIPWSYLAFQKFNKLQKPNGMILITGLLFAAFCESIQYFLPYRAFNINDLAANFLGVMLGSVALIPGVYSKLDMIIKIK